MMSEILLGPKWPNIALRSSATALYELKRLRDIDGLSWPEIAARKEYYPIPNSTLYDWYITGKYPEKWRKKLRIGDDVRYQRVCSMIDPESCADTLEGYMHETNINQLLTILQERGYGEATGDASNTIGVRRKD